MKIRYNAYILLERCIKFFNVHSSPFKKSRTFSTDTYAVLIVEKSKNSSYRIAPPGFIHYKLLYST